MRRRKSVRAARVQSRPSPPIPTRFSVCLPNKEIRVSGTSHITQLRRVTKHVHESQGTERAPVVLTPQCRETGGRGKTQVLFLPEASDYIASSPEESLSLAQDESSSRFVTGLCDAAREHGVGISVGIHVPAGTSAATIETATENVPKLFNRLVYIAPNGAVDAAATYDKLHLFDRGALQESRTVEAGKDGLTAPFPTPAGRVGPLICFDVRFAEASLILGQPKGWAERGTSAEGEGEEEKDTDDPWDPAQIIVFPSAFTVPTGRAHWEILLRARAVETQTYVVASAQVGRHMPSGKRVSYGHGMVVDPWGRVLVDLAGVVGDGPEEWEAEPGAVEDVGFADIDLHTWQSVRDDWPLRRAIPAKRRGRD
ncbi:carbon-nitrogen hydrolase [Zalerion maritima]|uniref:Carbon-nitrogen hydrolase n=1 Tax=Zalerion maritima TaxID=339359 RepID=A0AAD5RGC9_9PEZI|nr:carbon-nitrogen hydrolase [Zalerion maritima]